MKHGGLASLFALAFALAGACSSSSGEPAAEAGGGGHGGAAPAGQGGRTGSGGAAGGRGGGAGSSDAAAAGGSAAGGSAADAAMAGASGEGGGGVDAAAPDGAAVDAPAFPDAPAAPEPLPACARPSVDHLEIWEAHGGSLRPAVGGNLLVKEGDRHFAKVEFLSGAQWHEIVVPLVNALDKKVDLTASKGFTIRYSATADLWVQLRPLSHAHGGEQWTAKLPSTGGVVQDLFVSFAPASWGMLLGDPPFPFAQALRDANFFNFVAPPTSANTFVVRGLRIDGHVPPCS